MRTSRTQRGISTLLIAMLLLAIVTVIALFAASYAMYEQRTIGNDYRHKITFQAAEAGLNRGLAYIQVNTKTMLSTADGGWLYSGGSRRWQACTEAKPSTLAIDPCLVEPDTNRRASMYRYVGAAVSGNGELPLSSVLPPGKDTIKLDDGSGFEAAHAVYATLCRQDISGAVPRCSLSPTNEGTFYVTLVSVGTMAGENASASVKQSFGTYRLIGATPDAPLIASGTSIGLGNAQIVPNPNAGGRSGVPLSIWAKGNADIDAASFATCQRGEWLANFGTPAPSDDDVLNGVCASCTCNTLCPGYGLLSGNANSCSPAKSQLEGEDILDVDGHVSDALVRDSKYFPPDLFAYTFGVPGSTADAYLTANAKPVTSCNGLNPTSSGLIWNTSGTCDLSGKIGSLQDPVVLVSDTEVKIGAGAQFFGIIYVRASAGSTSFVANGTPQIYGSVILEASAKMSGTPSVIYNIAVLTNIRNSPNFLRYGPIPGSWSDTVSQ